MLAVGETKNSPEESGSDLCLTNLKVMLKMQTCTEELRFEKNEVSYCKKLIKFTLEHL